MFRPLTIHVLQQGPPWYQRTVQQVQVLFLAVLFLGAGVVYLWYSYVTRVNQSIADEATPEREMSDDEVIERLLINAGGELPQQRLIDRTGWSEAKVSRITTRLESEGSIEKIRVGRRNIVRLEERNHKTGSEVSPPGEEE